ncbi:hypothetical protein K7J14_14045 [Treponema zuelzerae]|uniref:Uncharacterized protein n=1 Tax=Teretinema zuelzerae TaxID=156 RepID=A0AAE3EK56_9SPIR|nr:hypothetical protein [Teretinema zuelzerae]MBN2810617.1 hypothetical protein [Spirochaetales bacterium]MCD1655815.1 hypothetical protein [Teretinema zuelzerae]HPO02969.1 hypothetical protein [Treponemataceae bacterium]
MKQENCAHSDPVPVLTGYERNVHTWGRAWMFAALAVMLAVPFAISVRYNAWPGFMPVLKGLLAVAPVFWTVCAIEVLTYAPMLGSGGTYLAFVTGNITNLKAPAALSAMQNAGVKPGTEAGEVLSTIAIAVTSIVTTLILVLGVALFSRLSPILAMPVLKPAFKMILPALFGGLAVVFVARNWKISVAPLAAMVILFLAVPSLAGAVSLLVPVGALVSIGFARLLYTRGLL